LAGARKARKWGSRGERSNFLIVTLYGNLNNDSQFPTRDKE
jgi:hypothetical protein